MANVNPIIGIINQCLDIAGHKKALNNEIQGVCFQPSFYRFFFPQQIGKIIGNRCFDLVFAQFPDERKRRLM
jgi:hypothetical protein